MKTTIKKLNKGELIKLDLALRKIEALEYRIYKMHSGGFAEAKMFDYDDNTIHVDFKFGIEDVGSGGKIYSEQLQLDRITMRVIN